MRHETLKALAIPHLLAIKDKMTETYGLSVLDERRPSNLIIYSIRGPDYTCFSFKDNTPTPLHTSAPGKALVAFLPEKKRRALLDRLTFDRLTPRTVTDRTRFEKRLAQIRRNGYSTDLAEEIDCCRCGGVAILDPNGCPVGALWFSGVDKRLPPKKLRAQIRHLQEAAKRIEAEVARTLASPTRSGRLSPCVKAALQAMAAPFDRPLDYAGLAKAHRVSYSTLRNRFLAETGASLGQHRLRLRLSEVQRRLAGTSQSVSEIAAATGFYDQKHLSAVFKKKSGLSPLAYRKSVNAHKGGV